MVSMEQRWQDLASVLLLPPGQETAPPPPPPPPPQHHLQLHQHQQSQHQQSQHQQQRLEPIGAEADLPTGFIPASGEEQPRFIWGL